MINGIFLGLGAVALIGAIAWTLYRRRRPIPPEVLLTIGRERGAEWRSCSIRITNLSDGPSRLLEVGLRRSAGGRIAPAIFVDGAWKPDIPRSGLTIITDKAIPARDYRDLEFFLKHPADAVGERAPLSFTAVTKLAAGGLSKLKIAAALPLDPTHPFQWTARGPRRPERDYRIER